MKQAGHYWRNLFVTILTCAAFIASAQDKTVVTMWLDTLAGGSQGSECFINNVIEPFNASSSTISVEATLQANTWDATRVALAGGAGPDIVGTPGPTLLVELAKTGQLLSLNPYIEKYGWDKVYAPWALSLGQVEGATYGLPNEVEAMIMYYNKTLFEQNGWSVPKTTDEMMALAATIKAAGIIPFAHANAEWRPANEWHMSTFFNAVAGPEAVYEALKGERPWTDPGFAEAVDLVNEMQQNGYFMGGLDRYYTTPFDQAYTALGKGDAAMLMEGTWLLDRIGNYFGETAGNANDWDWAPVPTKTGEPVYALGLGSTTSLNKNAENPDAAAEFLNYTIAPETQATLLVKCNSAPGPVILPSDALQSLDPREASVRTALGEAAASGNYGYTTWTFWPPKSDAYIIEGVEQVWGGQISTADYLQTLETTFQEEFKANAVPPIPDRQ